MTKKIKTVDYAEWYKRILMAIVTLMVGGIFSIGTEMKGDLKLALYKSDTNKGRIDTNRDIADENTVAIRMSQALYDDHEKRICMIEEVTQ